MLRFIATLSIATMALTAVSAAFAADGERKVRPTVCDHYSVAKGDDGSAIGICSSAKGRKSILRTYSIIDLKDSDGHPVKVMVGYR